METLGERLEILRIRLGKNHGEFASLVGLSTQAVKNIRKGTSPKSDFFERLSQNIENINLNWLVLGKGKMFLFEETTSNLLEEPKADYNKGPVDPVKNWELIMKLFGEIENLKEDVSGMRVQLRQVSKIA